MKHKKEGQHCNADLNKSDKVIIKPCATNVKETLTEYPKIVSIGEILDKLCPQMTRQNGARQI